MTTKKIYGPWIKWGGGECPVPEDAPVEVRFRDGDVDVGMGEAFAWGHDGGDADIVEYRRLYAEPEDMAEHLRLLGYTVTKPLTFEDVTPMTEAPPEGTVYWVVSALRGEGVFCVRFFNAEFDPLLLKRRMAYLEKEHALIAARHIFGLKGGEL